MLTDFAHRLLGAAPDGFGIFSFSIQALFTVAATSAFTLAGWSWIQTHFSRFKIRARSQGKWEVGWLGSVRFRLSDVAFCAIEIGGLLQRSSALAKNDPFVLSRSDPH